MSFAGTIRAVTPDDAPAIAAVHLRTWQTAYRGIVPDAHLDALTLDGYTARWEKNLQNPVGTTLVAETGAGVVGFVTFGPPADPDTSPPRSAAVHALYVLPEASGRGVGRALMAVALERLAAASYEAAFLWTWELNVRACAFYEGIGFDRDGNEVVSDRFGLPLKEVRYSRLLSEGPLPTGQGADLKVS